MTTKEKINTIGNFYATEMTNGEGIVVYRKCQLNGKDMDNKYFDDIWFLGRIQALDRDLKQDEEDNVENAILEIFNDSLDNVYYDALPNYIRLENNTIVKYNKEELEQFRGCERLVHNFKMDFNYTPILATKNINELLKENEKAEWNEKENKYYILEV